MSVNSNSTRIEIEVTNTQRELIERAALCLGVSVSKFVLATAEKAAKAIFKNHERIKVDAEQSRVLADLLLSPQIPNNNLRNAAAEHRSRLGS
jgi:uncharacterized protein (DUF1778 family)